MLKTCSSSRDTPSYAVFWRLSSHAIDMPFLEDSSFSVRVAAIVSYSPQFDSVVVFPVSIHPCSIILDAIQKSTSFNVPRKNLISAAWTRPVVNSATCTRLGIIIKIILQIYFHFVLRLSSRNESSNLFPKIMRNFKLVFLLSVQLWIWKNIVRKLKRYLMCIRSLVWSAVGGETEREF